MSKRIYLDFASTTPLDKKVYSVMKPFWSDSFGNPGSVHQEGSKASKALNAARRSVAGSIHAHPDEIIFTASGTEANNLAITGLIERLKEKGRRYEDMHMIVSEIEHSSVLRCAEALAKKGVQVEYLSVNADGVVKSDFLEKMMRPETILVSVMHANNEIGTVQPINRISKIIRSYRRNNNSEFPKFHCDACQSFLFLDASQDHLGADLIVLDAHKAYGPKGVGALYVRRGVELSSVIFGGEQERGLRAGTENVPQIIGMSEALSLALRRREKDSLRIKALRDRLISLLEKNDSIVINGHRILRLPNNVSISVPGLNSEFAVIRLDAKGIACSSRSACIDGGEGSYVIRALGRKDGTENSSVRFTLGRQTRKGDIEHAAAIIIGTVKEMLAC